jgi:hypothetical protein
MSTSPVVLAKFESKSSPGHYHEVRKGADGNVYCICPSWRFQKNSPANRTCKHIEQWKRTVEVAPGVSLMDAVGPGPEAIRAPRKARAAKPVAPPPRPTMTLSIHGRTVTVPVDEVEALAARYVSYG